MKRSEELREQIKDLQALKDKKYYEMVTSRLERILREMWQTVIGNYTTT